LQLLFCVVTLFNGVPPIVATMVPAIASLPAARIIFPRREEIERKKKKKEEKNRMKEERRLDAEEEKWIEAYLERMRTRQARLAMKSMEIKKRKRDDQMMKAKEARRKVRKEIRKEERKERKRKARKEERKEHRKKGQKKKKEAKRRRHTFPRSTLVRCLGGDD
jgi:hypothetical protein